MITCADITRRWSEMDHTNYRQLQVDGVWLQDLSLQAARQMEDLLDAGHDFIRDDYKEVAEITAKLLDVAHAQQRAFRLPGAVHHARWMSKVSLMNYCEQIGHD